MSAVLLKLFKIKLQIYLKQSQWNQNVQDKQNRQSDNYIFVIKM